MQRSLVALLAFLSLPPLLAGCGGSPSIETVRWEIQQRFPEARFEREEHVHLGRVKMGLLRGLVRMVPGKVEGQQFLSEVHRIEFATYKVRSLPDFERVEGDLRFEERLARAGWSMALRTREDDSRVWMFVRPNEEGSMRNLFIVDLEGAELTLVRVDGRLDRALAEAMADRPREAVQRVRGGPAS